LTAIRTIEITEPGRWNDLVLALPNCELHQGYEWGEIQRHRGSVPYRFAVMRDDRCIAAVQLLARRVRRLNEFVLYAPRGPLLDWGDGSAWTGVIEAVKRVAAQTGAVFLRVSPGVKATEDGAREAMLRRGFIQLAADRTVWNMPRITQALDLRPTEEQLKARMRRRTRQSLDTARRRGAVIEADNSVEAVMRLHRLMVRLEEQKGYPAMPLKWLLCEHREYYAAAAKGVTWIVAFQGEDLAAASAVRFGRAAYSLHLALDRSDAARGFHAGAALDWEAVHWAKAHACEVLNLGGSIRRFPPDQKDPGYGIYDYKRGFGASLNYLTGYYDLVFRPMRYRTFRLAERAQLLWERLQESMSRARVRGRQATDTDRAAPRPAHTLDEGQIVARAAANHNRLDGLNESAPGVPFPNSIHE